MSSRIGLLGLLMPMVLLASCSQWPPKPAEAKKKPMEMVLHVKLAQFESHAEVKQWFVRASDPPTVFELSTQHATEGKYSAKAIFPKYKEGSERWPAVILYKEHLAVTDWRPFSSLSFDIFSEYDGILPLCFHLRDEAGGRTGASELGIKKGQQTITISLDKLSGADLARVNEIHFFMTEPARSYTFYLDNIVLHSIDLADRWADLSEACDALMNELKSVSEATLPSATFAEVRELENIVGNFASVLANLPASLDVPTFTKHYLLLTRAEELRGRLQTDMPLLKVASAFRGKPFGYGWTSSLEKVYRQEVPFKGEVGGTLFVELARNEHEGVQLVLMPLTGNLKKVRVEVSDLNDGEGHTLSAKNIEVCPVGYVNTQKPPYKVDFVGWHPDPLLNFLKECDLEALCWQPFWIDVYAPRDQAPGLYTGRITVSAQDVPTMTVPFQVNVWAFTLSDGSRLPLAVAYFENNVAPIYIKDPAQQRLYLEYCQGKALREALERTEAERGLAIRQKCFDLILSHRLIPDNIYRSTPPLIEDVKYWKSRGARWFNIIHVGSVGSLKEGEPYPADRKKKILDTLADYVPELEKAGLLDMAYIYGFDEVRQNQFAAIKDIYGEIKKRYPKIPLMTTAYDESFGRDTGLDSVVDIWVPLTAKYDKLGPAIQAARARGRQVWWYICCGPHHPYANWFIEYPAMDHRLLMGYMAHKFQTQGFLYYSLALWSQYERDPKNPQGWKSKPYTTYIDSGPLTTWTGQSWTCYNGDGQIIYPGPDGPLSTIRMENIRDGIEDYEYLLLLKEAIGSVQSGERKMPDTWLRKAEDSLAVNPSLVESLTKYSTDGNLLLAERRKVAQLLEQYYKPK